MLCCAANYTNRCNKLGILLEVLGLVTEPLNQTTGSLPVESIQIDPFRSSQNVTKPHFLWYISDTYHPNNNQIVSQPFKSTNNKAQPKSTWTQVSLPVHACYTSHVVSAVGFLKSASGAASSSLCTAPWCQEPTLPNPVHAKMGNTHGWHSHHRSVTTS